jgi:hypothetical protein
VALVYGAMTSARALGSSEIFTYIAKGAVKGSSNFKIERLEIFNPIAA